MKELENEVNTLKQKMEKYEQVFERMNFMEETKKFISKFIQNENFSFCGIPNLIDKNPLLVNSIMIDETFQTIGPFGSERISRLK